MVTAGSRDRALPQVVRDGGLVVVACLLAFELASSGAFDAPGRLEVVVAGVVALGGLALLAVRAPGWLPAALVVAVSLVPYHLSFVGKTPFGVVTVTGALGALSLGLVLLVHGTTRTALLNGAEVWAMAGWVALMAASAALSPDFRSTVSTVRMIAVAMPAAYLVGRVVADLDPRALQRVVVAVGVVSVLAVLEELTHLSVYDLVPSSGFPLAPPPEAVRSGLLRVRLGYYHGSTLGTLLAVGLAVVLVGRRTGTSRRRRWVLPVLLAALFCTLTFQAWVAALLAVVVLAAGLSRLRSGLVVAAVVGGLVLTTGALPQLNQLLDDRLHPTGASADEYAYRQQLWPASLAYASHAPTLGAGPGQFDQLRITGTVRGETVQLVDDNTFTAKLVETGWPGLALLVLVLVLVARRMALNRERRLAWAGLAALTAWVVMALSVELLAGDQVLLPCWLVLGLLSVSPSPDAVAAGTGEAS